MRLKHNNKGIVLTMVVGFVLIFTMLGLASLNYAGQQNTEVEKRRMSTEAFWLADGAVEKALSHLPAVYLNENGMTDMNADGEYDVSVGIGCTGCSHIWDITAEGRFNGQVRKILATAARYDIDKILTTHGDIKKYDPVTATCKFGAVVIDCDKVESNNKEFSLETVLGLNYTDIKDEAAINGTFFPVTKSNYQSMASEVGTISGVTVFELEPDVKGLTIPNTNFNGSNLLIIDTSRVTGTAPAISMEGGDFTGIIWIIGEAEFTGIPTIIGSIFVDGDESEETKMTGGGTFIYDQQAIDDAIGSLGSLTHFQKIRIVEWEEI